MNIHRILGIICLFRGHEIEIAGYCQQPIIEGMAYYRCPRCHCPVYGGFSEIKKKSKDI